ncbi:MAG: lipoyl(octanoyl) transferase LipB [Planctomycetes bacterium]|nr:lipoyl(octanoyl) transferase LipB [Planctomycetota bacterium]
MMATPDLRVTDLGRMAYPAALELQRRTHQHVLDGIDPPTILLVEHDPVITVSQRKESPAHLLASRERLAELGIDVQPTDRGGDITYHGPGQLVVYPILRLTDYGLNVGGYMRLLEQAVIDAAAAFGIEALRDPPNTGVWVRIGVPATGELRKIAAVGVRVKRNVTLHGLALNVTTDLSHFDTIVPCGLPGRSVTSLAALLGGRVPAMDAVKRAVTAALGRALTQRTALPHGGEGGA